MGHGHRTVGHGPVSAHATFGTQRAFRRATEGGAINAHIINILQKNNVIYNVSDKKKINPEPLEALKGRRRMPCCGAIVFDKTTCKNRKCKNKKKDYRCCRRHSKSFAIKIQKAWIDYRNKKRFNLFKTLPDDIWTIVLNFITNDAIKTRLKICEKVYTSRINNIYNKYMNGVARSFFLIEYDDHVNLFNYIKYRKDIEELINKC